MRSSRTEYPHNNCQKTEGRIKLPPLPYVYEALEPHIDAKTIGFHDDRHHAAYVKNLNAALDKHPELKNKGVEDLLKDLDRVPGDIRNTVRNNGGGHINDATFWAIMKPNGGGNICVLCNNGGKPGMWSGRFSS